MPGIAINGSIRTAVVMLEVSRGRWAILAAYLTTLSISGFLGNCGQHVGQDPPAQHFAM
jgi:hypothetical protein